MSQIIDIKNVEKVFQIKSDKIFGPTKELYALNNINLSVKSGKTLGIIGESGCGKSTLARCIVKLHDLTSGEIKYKQTNINTLEGESLKKYRKEVQMIFQDPFSSLNPHKTCYKIVEEPLIIHNICQDADERKEKVIELLKEVGINYRHMYRYPHEFSGGQRQRINIARALSLSPEVIVCDEPVSALDVSIQAQILNLFKELQGKYKITYIFISHDLSVIRHISHEVAIMYLGQLVEFCDVDEIFNQPLHPYTEALISAIPPDSPFEENKEIMLKGELVSSIGKPSCCPLHHRCPKAMDICKKNVPELKQVGPNHKVACFLY